MRARTRIIGVIAAAMALTSFGSVDAVPSAGTASDFASACTPEEGTPYGEVLIEDQVSFAGGDGVISNDCRVVLMPGATFVLRDVSLSGDGNFVVATSPNGGVGSEVQVVDSTISIGGDLELVPGATAGDQQVVDNDATVVVKRSTLNARGIILATSFDWQNGRTVVRDSQLTATDNIAIEASLAAGSGGVTHVVKSELSAGGDIDVATGADGRTVVLKSTVTAVGSVTVETGIGGSCRTMANTPTITCS
jgi:hypothetical protein